MFSSDSEAELIRQAVLGDRAALAQLLFENHDTLRRHIAAKLASGPLGHVSADDVLQQTFVRAAGGIATFEGEPRSFRAWLKTIATNLVLDARKRHRRERRSARAEGGAAIPADDDSMAQMVDRLAGDITPPVGRVARRECILRMRSAIANLAPEHREVVQRYYLLEESLQEIADAMGRSKEAVRGLCYRARKELRAIMGGSSLFFSK